MIPDFDNTGNLPPGVHPADWNLFAARFGGNGCRQKLLRGMWLAVTVLKQSGCTRLYVDGSFVTSKATPSDFDALWDVVGVDTIDLKRREPVFFDYGNGRAAQKLKFGGEFFPTTSVEGRSGRSFLTFFQTDRNTGDPKGIVSLDL